ncbi:MAG TPA: hypothetical protein VF701_14905 [Thermoanaerobaculia bacterium]
MDAPGRTYIRLTSSNRIQIDRLRRHHAWTRDRLVNQIVAEYLDRIYEELRASHRKRSAA